MRGMYRDLRLIMRIKTYEKRGKEWKLYRIQALLLRATQCGFQHHGKLIIHCSHGELSWTWTCHSRSGLKYSSVRLKGVEEQSDESFTCYSACGEIQHTELEAISSMWKKGQMKWISHLLLSHKEGAKGWALREVGNGGKQVQHANRCQAPETNRDKYDGSATLWQHKSSHSFKSHRFNQQEIYSSL